MENPSIDENAAVQQEAAQAMSPIKGLMIVMAIASVIVCFLLLTNYLGITEFWAGFLWLFYWAGIEQMRFDKLNTAVVGAGLGLLVAFSMHALPELMPTGGFVIALGLVVTLVYCQVMGWAKNVVNNATMLFLTVGTIPHLQSGANFPEMFMALLVGVVFFGGLLWIGSQVLKKRAS